MPAEIRQPLAVLFTLPDGVIHQGSLHDLPDKQLAADLAVGLVASTHPHGPIRTRSVARHYMTTMRRMARDLGDWGVTGGLADLSPGTLVQYWLTCDYHRERRIRVVLSAFQETAGGLDPGIRRHLAGRRINKAGKSQPNRPYSDGEWRRLEAACTGQIAAARRAHRQALEAAAAAPTPPFTASPLTISPGSGSARGPQRREGSPSGSTPGTPVLTERRSWRSKRRSSRPRTRRSPTSRCLRCARASSSTASTH